MKVVLYVPNFLDLMKAEKNEDFREFFQDLIETRNSDYYAKPCGWKQIPVPHLMPDWISAHLSAIGKDDLRYKIGNLASGKLSCGYEIHATADSFCSASYLSSGANYSWINWDCARGLTIGYNGRRHGMNIDRLIPREVLNQLIDNPGLASLVQYETQEKDWAWWETADSHR